LSPQFAGALESLIERCPVTLERGRLFIKVLKRNRFFGKKKVAFEVGFR
jgi:hypothetical protein